MEKILLAITYTLFSKGFIENEDIDKCSYGLEVFFISILETLSILIFSMVIKNFVETFLFFLTFISLRMYAGGYHANTRIGCYTTLIINYIFFTVLLQVIPKNIYFVFIYFEMIFTVIVIFLFSPVVHKNKNVSIIEISTYRNMSIMIYVIQVIIIIISMIVIKNNLFTISLVLGQLSVSISILAAIFKNYFIVK